MDGVALRRVALFLAVGGVGVFVNLGAFAAARSAVHDGREGLVGAEAAGAAPKKMRCTCASFAEDRVAGAGGLAARARLFGEFCASSAVAVGVQLGVAAALRFRAPGGAAQLCGILCGTAINFAAHWVVFARAGAERREAEHSLRSVSSRRTA